MRCIDSWQVSCRWQTLREGRSVSKAFETTKKELGLNTWEQKLVHRNAGQIRTSQPLCSSPLFSSMDRGGIEVGLWKEKARVPSPSFSAQVEPKLAKGENIDYWAMFQVLLMTGNCHRHFNDWPRTYSTSQTPKKSWVLPQLLSRGKKKNWMWGNKTYILSPSEQTIYFLSKPLI